MSLYKKIAGVLAAIISLVLLNDAVLAQSSAKGSATVTVVRPVTVVGISHVNQLIATSGSTDFLKVVQKQSGKQAHKSSFLLPLVKQTITFATLQVRDASDSDFNVTLPTSTILKKTADTETLTAYNFEYKEQILPKDHLKTLQLMATVAMATDQATGIYKSVQVEVAVNYD